MLSAQPVRPTEILCMQFNGITGVEKGGKEFVQVKIEFRGIPAAKRKQEPEQVLNLKRFFRSVQISVRNLTN